MIYFVSPLFQTGDFPPRACTLAAWTLEKHYFGQDQDYLDVLWLGACKNANEMGAGTDNYLANGGAVQAGFMEILTCADNSQS